MPPNSLRAGSCAYTSVSSYNQWAQAICDLHGELPIFTLLEHRSSLRHASTAGHPYSCKSFPVLYLWDCLFANLLFFFGLLPWSLFMVILPKCFYQKKKQRHRTASNLQMCPFLHTPDHISLTAVIFAGLSPSLLDRQGATPCDGGTEGKARGWKAQLLERSQETARIRGLREL